MRIWQKLFVVLVVATVAVVAMALAMTRWSFNRGFLEYVNAIETQRIEQLAVELAEEFAADGGWDALAADPRRWAQLTDSPPHRRMGRRGPPPGEGRPPPPGELSPEGRPPPPGAPPGEGRPSRSEEPAREGRSRFGGVLRQPIDLLDSERNVLFGKRESHRDTRLHPIDSDGVTVGYLRFNPIAGLGQLDDAAERAFLTQQRQGLVWIALSVLAIAALLAALLSRQLVAPVRSLAAGSRALSAGQFDQRIAVTSRDELGQLASDFNRMAEVLERNRDMQRQWIADIAHELRTPLAIVVGELQAVEDGVRSWSDATRESLQAEVERLRVLIDDLHELSLADAGALTMEPARIDLVPLIEGVLDASRRRIEAAGLQLTRDLPATVVLHGDARRLEQVLHNLVENSCRYARNGGTLRVACDAADNMITMIVEDDGPGVPPEALPRLFERLYRVEASRGRKHGGAGLGLAICASIVSAHGGTMSASTSPLGGLRITVELPVEYA